MRGDPQLAAGAKEIKSGGSIEEAKSKYLREAEAARETHKRMDEIEELLRLLKEGEEPLASWEKNEVEDQDDEEEEEESEDDEEYADGENDDKTMADGREVSTMGCSFCQGRPMAEICQHPRRNIGRCAQCATGYFAACGRCGRTPFCPWHSCDCGRSTTWRRTFWHWFTFRHDLMSLSIG